MVTCPTSHDRAVRPISIWASPVPAAARPPVKNNGRDGAIMMTVRRCCYFIAFLARVHTEQPSTHPTETLGDPSIMHGLAPQTQVDHALSLHVGHRQPSTQRQLVRLRLHRRPHFAHLWVRLLERAPPSIPDAGSSDRLFVRFQPRCWSNGRALIACVLCKSK